MAHVEDRGLGAWRRGAEGAKEGALVARRKHDERVVGHDQVTACKRARRHHDPPHGGCFLETQALTYRQRCKRRSWRQRSHFTK